MSNKFFVSVISFLACFSATAAYSSTTSANVIKIKLIGHTASSAKAASDKVGTAVTQGAYRGARNSTYSVDTSKGAQPASNAPSISNSEHRLWQLSAGLGYVNYNDAKSNDGSVVAGRLALGLNPLRWKYIAMGIETGIQSGHRMTIDLPQDILYEMGGTDIPTTVNPMVDLLATLQVALNKSNTVFLNVKGGAVYRQWIFDYADISNKTQISPELQAGLGFQISPHTKIAALYQGIHGGDMSFKTHQINNYSYAATIDNIPSQQGGFLNIEIEL